MSLSNCSANGETIVINGDGCSNGKVSTVATSDFKCATCSGTTAIDAAAIDNPSSKQRCSGCKPRKRNISSGISSSDDDYHESSSGKKDAAQADTNGCGGGGKCYSENGKIGDDSVSQVVTNGSDKISVVVGDEDEYTYIRKLTRYIHTFLKAYFPIHISIFTYSKICEKISDLHLTFFVK